MKHFAYLLPVCCLLFAACRKDSPATEIIPTPRSVKAGFNWDSAAGALDGLHA